MPKKQARDRRVCWDFGVIHHVSRIRKICHWEPIRHSRIHSLAAITGIISLIILLCRQKFLEHETARFNALYGRVGPTTNIHTYAYRLLKMCIGKNYRKFGHLKFAHANFWVLRLAAKQLTPLHSFTIQRCRPTNSKLQQFSLQKYSSQRGQQMGTFTSRNCKEIGLVVTRRHV